MSPPCCCQKSTPVADSRSWRWRGFCLHGMIDVIAWVIPGTLLALMPKCPMCLVAYVALASGFTLSYNSASLLLHALTALCSTTLVFYLAKRLIKFIRSK